MKKNKLPLFLFGLLGILIGCNNSVTEVNDIEITKHPTSTTYVLTKISPDDVVPLSVDATSEYDLSYQWYKSTSIANSGGTKISGATGKTYKPPVFDLDEGDHYYYAAVKNSAGTVRSRVAVITVVVLEITEQPASRYYAPGDIILPLTVKTEDDTKFAFKWFSNTSFSNKGGTTIGGATNASYTPTLTANGSYYYYAEITFGTREPVATKPVLIRISASGDIEAPTQFKIGPTRLNYVRGVGGTGSFMFRTGGNADASPDADVTYIDQLFGELGCNILRIMVQDDYLNYINNAVQSRNSTVFYHNARDNFFPVIRRVNELGGYVFANPWTAPVRMKAETPDASDQGQAPAPNGGYLRQNGPNYVDYAEHLRGFLKWLNKNNAPIFCLGILNEPDFGGGADYEGMGMDGAVSRDWFRTVGHFTTQMVPNRNQASVNYTAFMEDIIRGYGGGKPTHHVLTMSGDSMGNVAGYMDPQINTNIAAVTSTSTGSNNRIEVIGRHYYSNHGRYTDVVGPVTGAWSARPQLYNYEGPYEEESLAMSPQMYAPGSTAGNIKREVWQTEHDFNFWGTSTAAPTSNPQYNWNSAFAALQDIDWCVRVVGESVFNWWYSASFSGLVTSYQTAPPVPPRTILPRGRAFAHYARYINETWLLNIDRTKGTITFNDPGSGTNGDFDAGSTVPKISAFEDTDGKFISIVMYAPSTSTNNGLISSAYGQGGVAGNDDPRRGSTNVGRIEVVLPEGFTATGAAAIRSYGNSRADGQAWDDVPNGSPRYWIDEPAILSADGKSVEVTLKGGNVISIMVKGSWSGAQAASRHFEPRVRPYTVK